MGEEGEEGEGTFAVQIQRSLQSGKQRDKGLSLRRVMVLLLWSVTGGRSGERAEAAARLSLAHLP